ncbi:related to NADPH-dependent alpha-keto amide reductase [Saccharomycodes ludwigii]|uniref:Related to NADPH-dependent alpha-keto amide reductase n=1 Tax=Saccharomycodes ludwigii TaxID=36035 RepID=A0A376B4L0_9ASCO|nr:hypothetical protein SCDLUD_002260 [Saccharomycodes ludwigii]KAH3900807.1 hypothetical protein SCDLUD_002260 [Saccharomycodes ludwigii]SSD59519.1 related to NADPH-dependent alpha-keto amide reductase [Saccharomycodes ludwigii]
MTTIPTLELPPQPVGNDNPTKLPPQRIPIIGFGSGTKWRITKSSGETKGKFIQQLADQVKNAIEVGFNHIDTAEAYKTHDEVGVGIKESGIPREKLWITDKYTTWSWLWRKGTGPLDSLTISLKKMDLEYVDLYLLHTPTITLETSGITLKEAWKQMETIYESGLAKNIGVSNFSVADLEYIKSFGKYKPQVNQIEFHAYLQAQTPGIVKYCFDNGIIVEGYSPLTPITKARPGPLDNLLTNLAEKYGKSELQILLRWVTQYGVVVLTTSSKRERLLEAIDIFSFELSKQDFEEISKIGKQKVFRSVFNENYDKYNNVLYD